MEIIGKRIKQIRLSKKLTQDELAEKLELTKSYISKLENGVTIPNVSLLYSLADILNVSVHEFFIEQLKSHADDKWQIVNNYFDEKNISPEEVMIFIKVMKKL